MNTPYKPSWGEHEKDLRSADSKKQDQAAEAFDETRKKEMATSLKAKRWEEDRKKQIAKDKPAYVKNRIASELDPVEEFKKQLAEGGKFDAEFEPMPGYLVLQLDEAPTKTTSGIILPDSAGELKNTGIILAEGGVQYDTPTVYRPLKVGSRVLFKKGAGMNIELKWGKCCLMGFGDILGVLK